MAAYRVPARTAYWLWMLALLGVALHGGWLWLLQLEQGLSLTGLSRDVSWGLYIAQFTYLVGVGASAVVLMLPVRGHGNRVLRPLLIWGELLAVGAVSMCLLFVLADLGQPWRMLQLIVHPSPSSIMFWDMLVLTAYLGLSLAMGWAMLEAERLHAPTPLWVRPLSAVAIGLAISTHTMTAFLYAGLPGRPYWLSALLAARFLASAFCSGPAVLLLLLLMLRRLCGLKLPPAAVRQLRVIITYALGLNVFFVLLELFTALYSGIPSHATPLRHVLTGWMGACVGLAVSMALLALALLLIPCARRSAAVLPWALGMIVVATWLDKGLVMVVGGFTPSLFGQASPYVPTLTELGIALGIYATGALIVSALWRVALDVERKSQYCEAIDG